MSTLEIRGATTGDAQSASPSPAAGSTASNPTLAGWKARGLHSITLQSGQTVKARIPDLSAMLAMGQIPDQLRHAALLQAFKEEGDPPLALQTKDDGSPLLDQQLVQDFYDLRAHVIVATLVDPELTVDDVQDVPVEDRDMIYAIAMRERFTDARGVTLGVEPLSRWETFRRLHSCPEDCPHCKKVVGELSSVDLGGV